jgi:hypothetical protein
MQQKLFTNRYFLLLSGDYTYLRCFQVLFSNVNNVTNTRNNCISLELLMCGRTAKTELIQKQFQKCHHDDTMMYTNV